jgi:predicted outer membrane protein
MKMRRHLWGVGLGVALCCGAAWAQDTGTQKQQQREGVQLGEAAEDQIGFTQQVAFLDQTQIALGKLALEKSQDPGVRAFAQKLVQDHQQHLQSLQTFAEANTLNLALVDLGAADMAVGGSGPVEGPAGVAMEERSVKYQDAYLKQVNAFTTLRSQLSQLQGRDFDKAFLEQVSNYQKQGQKLVNTGLSRFRDDTAFSLLLERLVPVLQSHQSQAQSLVKALDQKQKP